MSLVENNQIQHKDIETTPITSLNKVQLIAKVTLLEEIVQTKVRREAEIEQITQQLQEVMKQKIADIEQRLEQKVADFLASTEPDNNFAERFEQQKRKSDRVAEAEQLFFDFFATDDYEEYVGLLKLDYRSNMCFLNFDYVNEFDKTHLFEHDLGQFLLRHAFASSQTNMHKKRVEIHIERSNS